jgi:hypothetical protein
MTQMIEPGPDNNRKSSLDESKANKEFPAYPHTSSPASLI